MRHLRLNPIIRPETKGVKKIGFNDIGIRRMDSELT